MAQTPAIYRAKGDKIDYTPVGAVIAGQVIVLGDIIGVAEKDIPAGDVGSLSVKGSWDLPKTSDAFSQGDDVFWNASGNPVVGTAGTGAADNATGVLIGKAADDAAETDAYVRTVLTSTVINIATVGGSLTADDITGGDSTLTITGKVGSSSAGGLVSVTGGAGNGTTNVGGAANLVAGQGAVSGAGGVATVAGGAGGLTRGGGGGPGGSGGGGDQQKKERGGGPGSRGREAWLWHGWSGRHRRREHFKRHVGQRNPRYADRGLRSRRQRHRQRQSTHRGRRHRFQCRQRSGRQVAGSDCGRPRDDSQSILRLDSRRFSQRQRHDQRRLGQCGFRARPQYAAALLRIECRCVVH